MKQTNLVWHALGIALTVPALTMMVQGAINPFHTLVLAIGALFTMVGTLLNVTHNQYATFSEKVSPLFLDFGVNFFAAGLFLTPSLAKVMFLLWGVIFVGVYLLIFKAEHLN